jgi:hypothetical protein
MRQVIRQYNGENNIVKGAFRELIEKVEPLLSG